MSPRRPSEKLSPARFVAQARKRSNFKLDPKGDVTVYKCIRCKREVEVESEYGGIRCPYCGHRILVKERPTIIKKVKVL